MKMKKAEGAPSTGNIERLSIYVTVVIVAIVLITRFSEISVTTSEAIAADGISAANEIAEIADPELQISEKQKVLPEEVEPETEFVQNKKYLTRKEAEKFYYPLVVKVSKRYQVDPLLVRAIIVAESGFNPKAVSRVGAQGLMQLMPNTAKAMGVVDSFNPEHNIDGGVKYLKRLIDRFDGDVKLALAAYNAGSRRVRQYRGVPPYAETRHYINKIYTLLANYKKIEEEAEETILVSQT